MNEFLVVGVLLALVGVRVLIVGVLAALIIRPVRGCPACFRETVPVQPRLHLLLPRRFEWRWCASCGWSGPARRIPDEPGRPATAPPSRSVRPG